MGPLLPFTCLCSNARLESRARIIKNRKGGKRRLLSSVMVVWYVGRERKFPVFFKFPGFIFQQLIERNLPPCLRYARIP